MDNEYRELVGTLKDVESNFRGYVDQPQHSEAVNFANNIKRVIQDASSKKNPRSLEDQVKQLIELTKHIDDSDEVMDVRHARELTNQLEDARNNLRKFSNY